MACNGIHRAGPPQAVQKVREGLYAIQVTLSGVPSADWKRLFYDLPRDAPADFPPRSVEMTGTILRFRAGPDDVEARVALLDRWMERANQKEAAFGMRSEEDRRRREELRREQQELAEINARWAGL